MRRLTQHLVFLILLAAALPWLSPAWAGLLSDWRDPSQAMEYVVVIPALSMLLLWWRRRRVAQAMGGGEPWAALPLAALAAGFFFLGLRGEQSRFLEVAAVGLLLALPLAAYGRGVLREVWFPVVLLLFVIPVGFLDNLTVPLRRASVAVTVCLLNGLGVGARQVGTAIVAQGEPFFQLDVADPCSGIRSLVALFVGTAAYGALMLHGVWRRWVLFWASVPIAFLGNILRLLLTGLACRLVSQQAGMSLHDNALFLVAPVYAGLVFWLTERLRRGDAAGAPPAKPREAVGGWLEGFSRRGAAGLLVLLAGMVGVWLYCRQTPPLTFESDAFLAPEFASLAGAARLEARFCQNRACLWANFFPVGEAVPERCPACESALRPVSRAEVDILPQDTQCRKVAYRLETGETFTVSLVVAGKSRFSIHRPELCLPAQGYVLSERTVREILPGVPMACFSISQEGALNVGGFAYCFLNSRGASVSNMKRVVGDVWERSVHNRIRRWAMVTVQAQHIDFRTPAGEAALRAFMEQLYPTLWAAGAQP